MSEPLTLRKLLPKFAKVWLVLFVYTLGMAALVNATRAPFWVAQASMALAPVATFVWFWRTFEMTKRLRERNAAMADNFRKRP